VTLGALLKLFLLEDSRVTSLMVIGYDPSHSNINSEVNAPFKILCVLLRFLEAEETGKWKKSTVHRHQAQGEDEDEEEEKIDPGFSMQRGGGGYGGERLDTMEGEDDYGEEEEKNFSSALEVADDDLKDQQDDEDEELLGQKPVPKSIENLFAIKDHTSDKGLGGLDGTASEVYMSELLAGYDMEDFDETEEQNEEDLLELADSFADC